MKNVPNIIISILDAATAKLMTQYFLLPNVISLFLVSNLSAGNRTKLSSVLFSMCIMRFTLYRFIVKSSINDIEMVLIFYSYPNERNVF
jgi:hypothetical protein